jgi:hypothetical protein
MNSPMAPKSYLLGGIAGLLVAVVGAYGWVQLTASSGKIFGAVAVLIGMLTGGAVRWGTRQSSIGAGLLGGVSTLGALIGAHYFMRLNALLTVARAQGYTGVEDFSLLDAFRNMNGWDWLFVAMGVYFAVTLPLRPPAKPSVTSSP